MDRKRDKERDSIPIVHSTKIKREIEIDRKREERKREIFFLKV